MSGRLQGELEIEGVCDHILFYIYKYIFTVKVFIK